MGRRELREALLWGLVLGVILGQTWAPISAWAGGVSMARGGMAGGVQNGDFSGATVTASTVNATTGNFTAIDAGTILITGATTPLTFGNTSAEAVIMGMATDATTSSTVGAVSLKCGSDITATDLCAGFRDSAGNAIFACTEAGACTAPGKFVSSAANGSIAYQSVAGAYSCFDGASCSYNMRVNAATGVIEVQGVALAPNADLAMPLGAAAKRWPTFYAGPNIVQSCTLDGASPSKCSVTVVANAKCTCTPVGTGAPAATGVNLVTTTLTCYSANGLTNDVNIHCINPS